MRSGPTLTEFSLKIKVVTPIFGGGPLPGALDDADIIRAATIRGHLRFWWRALNGHKFAGPEDMYASESALWGCAAKKTGGRSTVEVRVERVQPSGANCADPAKDEAYALWPARSSPKERTPALPRRSSGTCFNLVLATSAEHETDLRNAVRAWIVFGGYGGRSRRGVGSLTVVGESDHWLPAEVSRQAFTDLFGYDVFASPDVSPRATPLLAGAALAVDQRPQRDAEAAWKTALKWLWEFRQGTKGTALTRAREPGSRMTEPNRPSISNWPEADKIRHLTRATGAHKPRHNDTPAWPRAGFGLPIQVHFQTKARNGSTLKEPPDVVISWEGCNGRTRQTRLASPLIVKPLPLVGERFHACALWLHRPYPEGKVILEGVNNSGAPFDLLVASEDTARFEPLLRGSLRQAFLQWLTQVGTDNIRMVAP